ncbi:MAG: YkgJ family cysteine cluster protein [Desulfobulbus sp.]|jgi:Fe-S-cluster containining protein|nr:YkgJ family cysteine cluster protein [Desulfobulbus sp.]
MHIHSKAEIFACARCGFCCHGETTVSLDEHDQERMIRALGLSREEVARRYWRVTGSTVQMQVRDGHCIFYDDDCGCTVHEGRPWRCRQWPLHPSMLDNENNYRTISESCPGIRKDVRYEEFRRILRALLDQSADGRLGT